MWVNYPEWKKIYERAVKKHAVSVTRGRTE